LLKILTLSGSLRAGSTNTSLLGALARNVPDRCRLIAHEGIGRLPIFNPDEEEPAPPEALRLADAVRAADGIVISSPEYAHGVPGGLKNALDWLVSGDAAIGKPAMLVHASPRSAISRAALAEILRTMSFDLWAGEELAIALIGKRPAEMDAILAEPANVQRMRETLARFADFIENRRSPITAA
jgi:chromate reductase, NAD(P)H dehydrogenase (quinone)